MDLILFFNALLKRKWILIIVPIACVTVTLLLTMGLKKSYVSKAKISTGFTIRQDLDGTAQRVTAYELGIKFSNVIETMTSQKVFGMLSYRLMLHDLNKSVRPFRVPERDKETQEKLSLIDPEQVKQVLLMRLDSIDVLNTFIEDDIDALELLEMYEYDYKSLRQVVNIRRVGQTDYIDIICSTEDPSLSAFIVNTLANSFLEYSDVVNTQRAARAVLTQAKLLEQKKKILDQKEDILGKFNQYNGVIDLEVEGSNILGQISDYQVLEEQQKRKIASLNIQMRNQKAKGGGSFSSGSSSSSINRRLLTVRSQIRDLNQRISSGTGNMGSMRDSLSILTSRQNELLKLMSSPQEGGGATSLDREKAELRTELLVARAELKSIQGKLDLLKRDVTGVTTKNSKQLAIQRELETASEEYLEAQADYNKALAAEQSKLEAMTIYDEGQPAAEPEPSKRLILTALSGAASFIFCAVFIILLTYLDDSITTPGNFKKEVELPLIGALSELNLKKYPIVKLFKLPPSKKQPFVFRESLRKLRYEIENSDSRIFLITSIKVKEGKSLVIQSLSHALSLNKKKVLLIDTNFPNNELTKFYKAKPTLEKFVNEGSENDMRAAISKTTNPLIDVIGSRGGAYSPSEIFMEDRFEMTLSALAPHYDYIFMEGPALNKHVDSKELSAYVDSVIPVFSAQSSIKQIDLSSLEFLYDIKEKSKGAVLNHIEIEHMA